MDERQATPEAWKAWLSYVSGDDEDLAEVFKNVRRDRTLATQVKWAQDWRTRAFCDLGLHLIYEHHIRRTPNGRREESRIFANVQASDLQNHAQLGFFPEEEAEQLDVDRFNATWGQQGAFCQDLIAYLFRPTPYLRRLASRHPQIIETASDLTLRDWILSTAKAELDSAASNPLVSLHTFVETVLPQDPDVRFYVHRFRCLRLQRWADLYERVLTAYGAPLRDTEDLDWLSFAERLSAMAGGMVLRAQTRTTDSTSGADGDMFGRMLVEYLPALLAIGPDEIATRRLQQPVADA